MTVSVASIQRLPDELLLRLLLHVSADGAGVHHLLAAARVSRRWARVARDPRLWRAVTITQVLLSEGVTSRRRNWRLLYCAGFPDRGPDSVSRRRGGAGVRGARWDLQLPAHSRTQLWLWP